MNEPNDKLQDIDPEVRSTYQDLARESAPADVDAAILKMADQATATGTGLFRLNTWLRPLTFVATAAVSLALLIQISNTPQFDVPDSVAPAVTPQPANPFQDAAEQTAEQIRQLEQESSMSMSPEPTAPAAMAAPTIEPSLLPASEHCDEQARDTSASWWRCIGELEQRGLPEAAEKELQALLNTYPQFSAPQ